MFTWEKWRVSIIRNWVRLNDNVETNQDIFDKTVVSEFKQLELPDNIRLQLYWVCCVTSKYSLDYPDTYTKIVIPSEILINGRELNIGIRSYSPSIVDEKDIRLLAVQHRLAISAMITIYSSSFSSLMFMKDNSEFMKILKGIRGRPSRIKKRGQVPDYDDSLAVQCAALKNEGTSYVKIAENFSLPVTRPFSSCQSDIAKHLVQRGRKILRELSDVHSGE